MQEETSVTQAIRIVGLKSCREVNSAEKLNCESRKVQNWLTPKTDGDEGGDAFESFARHPHQFMFLVRGLNN